MSEPEDGAPERRTLVLALTTRDGTLAQSVLQQGGIASTVCRDLDQLCAELDEGAAAVLLTEETLTLPGADRLLTALEQGDVRWGKTPFRIGLWVGRRTTPNRTDDAAEATQDAYLKAGSTGTACGRSTTRPATSTAPP